MGALRLADAVLRAPLGMKTLDPSDSQYRPDYDNSNDGADQSVAKGWNVSPLPSRPRCTWAEVVQYHQGPEWGFPLGWFLMAWLKFDRIAGDGRKVSSNTMINECKLNSKQDPQATMHYISNILLNLARHIENDPWRGLPELTNHGESSFSATRFDI